MKHVAASRIFFPYTVGSIINRRQYHFNRVQYHLKISSSGKVFNNTEKTFCEEKLRRVCKSKHGANNKYKYPMNNDKVDLRK